MPNPNEGGGINDITPKTYSSLFYPFALYEASDNSSYSQALAHPLTHGIQCYNPQV